MREAHRGCRSGQSEHTWFSGRAIRALRRFLSCCWEAMVVWFVWEYLLLAAEQCGWIGRRVRVPGAVFSRSLRTRFMARDVLLLHRMRSCPKMNADDLSQRLFSERQCNATALPVQCYRYEIRPIQLAQLLPARRRSVGPPDDK